MNSRHSKVTDWGLSRIEIEKQYTILDVGCGGGRTLSKLAAVVSAGRVFGIDHSDESVAASQKTNVNWIAMGRVEVRLGSVSQLPFADDMFDLVTAVETHFWWPNLQEGMREISRVLKMGGKLVLIAEVYKGASSTMSRLVEKHSQKTGLVLLDLQEHRELFANAGFSQIEITTQPEKGWICAVGTKAPRRENGAH
jgi:ubiquinone/menaquinone biosynthesis C-methylase UbiE